MHAWALLTEGWSDFYLLLFLLSRRRQLRAELFGIILSAILFELFPCECARTIFFAIWQPLYTCLKYFFDIFFFSNM